MKTSFCIFAILFLIPLYSLYSQEKIDVIYLKSGHLYKGTIIENVINKYIRIELQNDSIVKVNYSKIVKIEKETVSDQDTTNNAPQEKISSPAPTVTSPPEKNRLNKSQGERMDVPATSTVNAQQSVTYALGANAGIAVSALESDLSDYYGLGYGGGVHFDINIFQFLTTRMNVEYYFFPSDKSKFPQLVAFGLAEQAGYSDFYAPTVAGKLEPYISDISGATVSFFNVNFDVIGKLVTEASITPYGLFGIGIHSYSISDLTLNGPTVDLAVQGPARDNKGNVIISPLTASASELNINTGTRFGMNFGVGAEFDITHSYTLDIECKYVLIFTENNSNGAIPIMVGLTAKL